MIILITMIMIIIIVVVIMIVITNIILVQIHILILITTAAFSRKSSSLPLAGAQFHGPPLLAAWLPGCLATGLPGRAA